MGMVGGGPGAFIGQTPRRAARLEGIELVAGVFSTDPEKNREQGRALRLSLDRVYRDYQELIQSEQALPEGDRIDFVTIATPNHLHLPMARDFLEAGFHVVCDKPLAFGQENRLSLQVCGDRCSLEWRQEDPNYLRVMEGARPAAIWSRGQAYVADISPAAARASQLPGGHVEGFTEAFANIYRNGADAIRAALTGEPP
jgi:predicted dehydrogenase